MPVLFWFDLITGDNKTERENAYNNILQLQLAAFSSNVAYI
jgi:hypothetical protein